MALCIKISLVSVEVRDVDKGCNSLAVVLNMKGWEKESHDYCIDENIELEVAEIKDIQLKENNLLEYMQIRVDLYKLKNKILKEGLLYPMFHSLEKSLIG